MGPEGRLLDSLGITLGDLQTTPDPPARVPTVADFVPRVAAAAGPGARRTYGAYWNRMATAWGPRLLTDIANRAIADGYLDAKDSPAHRVAKPRRLPNARRALTAGELDEINRAARAGDNDVVLGTLLLRLHTETACRCGGALGLRLVDLDARRGLIRLTEKGGTQRWQPVSLTLASALDTHGRVRGATQPGDPLLRYRDGQPLTTRRYDSLWRRIGIQVPWVDAQGISAHWLRHTTLTWVERHFGYGTARAYAPSRPRGTAARAAPPPARMPGPRWIDRPGYEPSGGVESVSALAYNCAASLSLPT